MSIVEMPERESAGSGVLNALCEGLRTARPERMLVLGLVIQIGALIFTSVMFSMIAGSRFDPNTIGQASPPRFFNAVSMVGAVSSALTIIGWGLIIFAAARLVADAISARTQG